MNSITNFKKDKLLQNPPLLLGFSFAFVIFIGTIFLGLPISSVNGSSVGFINALFTATSATCVTGLIVVNTAVHWTIFGKIIILCLIQIGGLGTMVMFSMIALVLKRKIGLKHRLLIKEQLNTNSMTGMVRLIKYILVTSFSIETVGSILLATRFIPKYGFEKGLWFSIFHSVSAFCNAGFDITGNSLVDFNTDFIINITIIFLIFLGGIGFSVYSDIYNKRNFKKFNVHTKLVLVISVVLLIFGFLLFFLIEYNNLQTIGDSNLYEKLIISAFQSTTTRTAGFNTIGMDNIRDSSAFLMIILMFIGGSPSSTAGGLKTTTFGVMIFAAFSVIRGKREATFMKKTIPTNIILKCITITMICMGLVLTVALSLSICESDRFKFIDILFETVSAFGTVGLSRGITDSLGEISKIILTITMFLGRVGPTTLAIGLMRKKKLGNFKYSEGNFMVG